MQQHSVSSKAATLFQSVLPWGWDQPLKQQNHSLVLHLRRLYLVSEIWIFPAFSNARARPCRDATIKKIHPAFFFQLSLTPWHLVGHVNRERSIALQESIVACAVELSLGWWFRFVSRIYTRTHTRKLHSCKWGPKRSHLGNVRKTHTDICSNAKGRYVSPLLCSILEISQRLFAASARTVTSCTKCHNLGYCFIGVNVRSIHDTFALRKNVQPAFSLAVFSTHNLETSFEHQKRSAQLRHPGSSSTVSQLSFLPKYSTCSVIVLVIALKRPISPLFPLFLLLLLLHPNSSQRLSLASAFQQPSLTPQFLQKWPFLVLHVVVLLPEKP